MENNIKEKDINKEKGKNEYLLPLSIIIAAILISVSWIYATGLKNTRQAEQKQIPAKEDTAGLPGEIKIKPVDVNEHIRGSAGAPVKIIEFSDLECPFCKMFQQAMNQVMEEYGKDGRVAWIFRNYPLDSLHSKARKAAIGSECAAELGGNDKFWAYIDKYYEITPSNNQIDLKEIPKIGESIGLARAEFETCLNSDKFNQKINENIKDGTTAGLRGTPYSVIIGKGGKKLVINGALPLEDFKTEDGELVEGVRTLIEEALR